MRKWMRDRLQRRKKPTSETSDQAAPPPLQPAYFDANQQPDSTADAAASETSNEPTVMETPVSDSRPVRRSRSVPQELKSEPEPKPAEPQAEQPPAEARPVTSVRTSNTGRGRRRRGGRGRGGRGREQAVA